MQQGMLVSPPIFNDTMFMLTAFFGSPPPRSILKLTQVAVIQ
jgi:hypothetical protein